MKTTMKKTAACLLALLLIFQIVPVLADETYSATQGPIESYREKLEINSDSSIIEVGMMITLTVTEGYTLTWESSNESIATVQNGVVKAVAPGIVKITAREGQYNDSITLKIVGEEPKAEEDQGGEQEDTENKTPKFTVIVNGNKEKTVYNGEEQTASYKLVCKDDHFDESKVVFSNEDHLATGTDCGVYPDSLSASDFSYSGDAEVEFIVSNGWLQIKPAEVTVAANDATMTEGDPIPELTATVTGLLGDDEPDLIKYTLNASETNGWIEVKADSIQGNYKVTGLTGILTVIPMYTFPLYNIAQIGGAYYRLAKTSIRTTISELKPYFGKKLTTEQYRVEDYDFTDLKITVNGKEYVYACAANEDEIAEGANYYTVAFNNMEVIKSKIGAMDGNNPRWLVPESQRYGDPNATDSIHRNFKITLVESKNLIQQELFNMLSVDGNTNYHRLLKTTILAGPVENQQNAKPLNAGDYIMKAYDFKDVVVVIDGEEYKYSPVELTGEYDSYFTVTFKEIVRVDRVNNDVNWYNNKAGWLDGSYEQYGDQPNKVTGYHANYLATTHKGNRPARSVTITSNWKEGQKGYVGAKITLTAHLTGFQEGKYTLQWQHSTNGQDWVDEPDANGETFTYTLNEITTHYKWRVTATDVQ